MKKGILVFMACFVWLLLMFSANSSHAVSVSNSTATIYWDTLDISGIEIEWISKESGCWAEAQDGWDYDGSFDYNDGWVDTSASGSVTNAKADAWTTDLELYGGGWASSTGPYEAKSWAVAWRRGRFKALETGYLTISVDYYLTQDLSTQYLGEWVDGKVFAQLSLYNSDKDEVAGDGGFLYNYVSDGDGDHWEDSGTLIAWLWFDEGDRGVFEAVLNNYADVYSPVPVPSTMLLLGSGLAGLGVIGRRFRKMV